MKITTKKQVNILGWAIAGTLLICFLFTFLTDTEIISKTVGAALMGAVGLFEVVRRSEPGQQVFSDFPSVLPQNRFLQWSILLAGGIVIIDWVLDIGAFLLAG